MEKPFAGYVNIEWSEILRVSVALCSYNGEAFIEQQLESIAQQDFRPIELVICDDGSADGTVGIVERFTGKHADLDVRLICNPARLGTTRNFEQAIGLCSGEVIFLSDQDDVWMPGKIRRLLQEIDHGADLAFSNAQVVDQTLAPLGYQLWDSLWFNPAEQARVRDGRALEVFLKHVVAAGGTTAFRANLREVALPIPNLPVAHDAWLALMAAAVGRVHIVQDPLISYRLHDANQIGLRKLGLRQQFEQARKQIDHHAFRYAADLHIEALRRLTNGIPPRYRLHCQADRLLRQKIFHSESRDAMNGSAINHSKKILCELVTMRYFRYSYGWKSVAQDLFLRQRRTCEPGIHSSPSVTRSR